MEQRTYFNNLVKAIGESIFQSYKDKYFFYYLVAEDGSSLMFEIFRLKKNKSTKKQLKFRTDSLLFYTDMEADLPAFIDSEILFQPGNTFYLLDEDTVQDFLQYINISRTLVPSLVIPIEGYIENMFTGEDILYVEDYTILQ